MVYEVYDAEADARVALKWLRSSEASTIARFKREFRSLADLVHPNLVRFRELITVAGEWFFTMDLVVGVELLHYVRPASPIGDAPPPRPSVAPVEPLGETVAVRSQQAPPNATKASQPPPPRSGPEDEARLEGGRPLCAADLRRVRVTLEQLGAGLGAIHSASMLHRDVKPSNVLVTREGRVVLLDFGLVTDVGGDGVALTKTGHVVGTPAYMSPEQAMGLPLTPASDWYGVGVILFQALTGQLPFEGDPQAVLIQKQLVEAVSPSEIVRGVPKLLAELCSDLLSRTPERRPGAAEFLERLRRAVPTDLRASSTVGFTLPTNIPNPGAGVFVGRETHIWGLDEALDEAEHGKTVIALVHGASGMGKTSLVRHFLDTIRNERPEVVVLEGRCYERESVPYKALDSLIDSLSRYLQRLPAMEVAKLLPRDMEALARLFPVFLQLDTSGKKRTRSRMDAVQERRRAFGALRELLERVADHRPLVLFIDDLQWGDGDSEPLLLALLRPPDPPPLLLLAAYRTEDAASAPLVRALRKLAGAGAPVEACEIPVGELSPEAATELASSLLGGGDDEVARDLARESCGSPLFLRQLAAFGGGGKTFDLAAALKKRVSSLPDDARALLQTLAVSGRPLPLAAAARAAGIEHDPQGVLAKLRAETLVRTRGIEARDEVEIYHDRIREVVIATLSEAELKALHKALASILSGSGDADAEALATHFSAAGERDLAAEYAAKAADRAVSALAFARGAQMYEMAIGLHSTLGKNAEGLVLKLAEALVSAGRGRDAAERFLAAARTASPADALELRRRGAEQLLFSGQITEGLEVVDQVLGAMKMTAPKTRLGVLFVLLWYRFVLRVRGIGYRERRADQFSRETLVRIDTCFSIALGLGMVDPMRGAVFQTRYLLLALRAGEPLRIAKGLALEAAYRGADGVRSAVAIDRLLAKASSLAERVGQPHALALAALMNGVSRVLLGDYRKAVILCDKAATELERCTGVSWELDNAHFFAGFSLLSCGRLRELAERLPAQLEDATARGDLYGEMLLRMQCSWFVNLAKGDVAQAKADLDVVTKEWAGGRFLLQHVWQMINGVEIALYEGDADVAWKLVEETWPRLKGSLFLRAETLRVRAVNTRARAALAAAQATKDSARRSELLAIAGADSRQLMGEKWTLAHGFGMVIDAGVLAASGDRTKAVDRLREAIAELETKDARLAAWGARFRLGRILGGDEGDTLVANASRDLEAELVVSPEKLARIFAPFDVS